MTDNYKSTNSEDNITLKDIILSFQRYFSEVVRKWWIIALLLVPISIYFGYKALNTPITYSASNRFIIEGGDSGALSGLGGLLGSFGFGKDSKTNPYKILEVAISTRILDQVLLDTLPGTNELTANEIIEKYELDKIWKERSELFENFRFKTNDKSKWELLDQKAYKQLVRFTIGNRKDRNKVLYRIGLDENGGIYHINCTTIDHDISYHVSNALFERLKDFFENKTLESQFQTKELLRSKRDSLSALIDYKSRELAQFEDRNRNSISSSSMIKKNKILTEISGLSIAYQETFKNFEIADFSYNDKKPYFMLIDQPLLPLSPLGGSLIVNLFIAILLSLFLGIMFIVVRRIYLDAMA